MEHKERTALILERLHVFPCIRQWQIGHVLGVGTVGTVILACKKKNKHCAAMKIQVLHNKTERHSFETELKNQQAFLPYAPKIYDHCLYSDKQSGVEFGILIMELLDEELDRYLTQKRSKEEIAAIGERIKDMLLFMKQKGYTHGDLALFNLAFVKNGPLVMLDFDRASTSVYAPAVDTLRLQTEMTKSTQSANTKSILPAHLRDLKRFVPQWHKALGTAQPKTAKDADRAWEEAYEVYCKEAHIKCLE